VRARRPSPSSRGCSPGISAPRWNSRLTKRFDGLSQPAASQHLKVLREAGLVRGRVDGRRRLYRVDPDGLDRLRRELEGYWGPAPVALKDAAER
jgi:DNA-binding transcriptional ArsR family regulator